MKKSSRHSSPRVIAWLELNMEEALAFAENFVAGQLEGTKEPRNAIEAYARQSHPEGLFVSSERGTLALDVWEGIQRVRDLRKKRRWDAACVQCLGLGVSLQALANLPVSQRPEDKITVALKAYCREKLTAGFSAPGVEKAREFIYKRKELYDLKVPSYWNSRSFDQRWQKVKAKCVAESKIAQGVNLSAKH